MRPARRCNAALGRAAGGDCATCQAKLDGPEATTPWCAFNEVHPRELLDQTPTAGVLIDARLLPAVEIPPQRGSLAGRFFGALGRILRLGYGRKAGMALTRKSG